jgi:hypothetical protein
VLGEQYVQDLPVQDSIGYGDPPDLQVRLRAAARPPRRLNRQAFPDRAVAQRPQFVLGALERELTKQSITNPRKSAREILSGVDDEIA